MERLTKFVDADFRVESPSSGSFVEVVTNYAAPFIADIQGLQAALHIPFGKLYPYILSKVIPKASGGERLALIAEKQADALQEAFSVLQARERTAQIQSEQETERLRIIAKLLRGQPDELKDNLQEAREIGDIVQKHVSDEARITMDDGPADFIASELSAEVERARVIESVEAELEQIDPAAEQALVEKVRRLLPDVATPLKRSATKMDFELGPDRAPIVSINKLRVDQISKVVKDDSVLIIKGSIKKLDKETGFGRFRPAQSRSTFSFSIPRELFVVNRQSFIDAFALREVSVETVPSRDGVGNIVRLTVLRVVPQAGQ